MAHSSLETGRRPREAPFAGLEGYARERFNWVKDQLTVNWQEARENRDELEATLLALAGYKPTDIEARDNCSVCCVFVQKE